MMKPAATIALLLIAATNQPLRAQAYDVVIRNGRLLDGAGNPWINADVGIRDGRFVRRRCHPPASSGWW